MRIPYDLTLPCSCIARVSAHPETGVVQTRLIQSRGTACRVRRHRIGVRLYLWELLPEQKFERQRVDVYQDLN
jgi:hypothetical protein